MNTNYTHITMIIDRSGSMSSSWTDVMGGYTQIVKDNKSQPGKCTFTVAAFDTEYELVEDFTDIQNVKEELTVRPRGGTALLDAIGKTIVSVGEQLAKLPEEERPGKVLLLVQTDGMENSSKEFTKEQIQELIKEHTEKYSWIFQFLGATVESIKDARAYGFGAGSTSLYSTNSTGDTFKVVAEKLGKIRGASSASEALCMADFSEEERSVMNS